jgi:hypothetical protein
MAGTLVHRWVYRYGVNELMSKVHVLLGGNWKVLAVNFLQDAGGFPLLDTPFMVPQSLACQSHTYGAIQH